MRIDLALPCAATLAASDLLIAIQPRGFTDIHGTSAQLCAEGLIPDGFKWPSRTERVSWTNEKFSFSVARSRPPGTKGPMSTWIAGDYWSLERCLNVDRLEVIRFAEIYKRSCELNAAILFGSAECCRLGERVSVAWQDSAYTAFRQRILGDDPRGPGRPRKTRSQA